MLTESVYYIQPKTFDFLLAIDGVGRIVVLPKIIGAYEVGGTFKVARTKQQK
jgi:hypothetical protein